MGDLVISSDNLQKSFRLGIFRKRVEALAGVSFAVEKNEIFGLLGPNGAGKTTFIKLLMGLIFPTAGSARVLGRPVPDLGAKQRIGFLPENPYFYDYLSCEELLDLMGRLFGLDARERRRRAGALLERVGLSRIVKESANLPLRKYSKGMLQRIGIAQALINDPELVVLDEPMSGLDPIGRREIRDLMVDLRREGKTVLFSTHILSDVELLCDRVAIIVDGKLRGSGPVDKLLSPRLLHTEVVLASGDRTEICEVAPDGDLDAVLRDALAAGKHVRSVTPRRESLEDLFMREVEAGTSRVSQS